ncbi:DNA polymerase III subunit alpha [Candidatus Peregrinibacteria bacterium]|nr:DNA polymerase III subunit alpha [Candidatus Peregrinibacteria bacterium]
MSFVHLHVHSHYSLLTGYGSPKAIVETAKEMGCPAVALTDNGALYGAIEFYKAAKDAGIKPIIGVDLSVVNGSRFDKNPGAKSKPYKITLLAKSYKGYQNLLYLVTKAHLEGFYYKPRVDKGLLESKKSDLIMITGSLGSEIAAAILSGTDNDRDEIINEYIKIYGKENIYFEVQNHPNVDDQKAVNEGLKNLSEKYKIDLVATNETFYIKKDDSTAQDLMLCIQNQTSIEAQGRFKLEDDYSLKTPDEMKKAFDDFPNAIANTLNIAEKIDIEIPFGQDLIPKFNTPNSVPNNEYLRELCENGLKKRYGESPEKNVYDRLNYELDIVEKMGFCDYFLIVWDFVKYAKDQGIAVGPGRGSAAGSLITYSLEITDLDPLKYGLIFERFLNPARISMPDVDIDFADTRRDEVLEYVRKKYGEENVAQIITFGTMAARAAVRDVGRALGLSYSYVDQIAKIIPPPVQGKHVPLKHSVENDAELKKIYSEDPEAKKLLDNAIKLEGTVRHTGTHACAVVMSEEPLVHYTPLQKATGGREDIITQYSMNVTEEIGLLKMDFLGLKNLTVIEKTLKIIKKNHEVDIDLNLINMDDEKTFELFQRGDTTGVFQLESSGMRRYLKELKPTQFEDIIAMISLYRPGPMEWIPVYIKGKNDPKTVRYLHKIFEPILNETYGVAIYQEQILQIARDFAGFSLGEADILRKAVGKKIGKLLQEQKEKFIAGAIKNGHGEKLAKEVFDKVIEPFSGYGFNKSHAACYAMISYRTAYLKAHYPVEFMAALLSADSDNTDKVVFEINDCSEMGIDVLPPDINESDSLFTPVGNNKIRFGLSAIKGLGHGTVDEIISKRKEQAFSSLEDFIKRVPSKLLNKKNMEALAYSGALDKFGDRKQIADSTDKITSYAKNIQNSVNEGQADLFAEMEEHEIGGKLDLNRVAESTFMEKLKWEKNYLGLFVSGHPLKGLKRYLSRKVNLIENLTKKNISKQIKIGGILTTAKRVMTKSGDYMLYGEIEDPTGKLDFVVFPRTFKQYGHFFEEDKILILEGKLEHRRAQPQLNVYSAKSVSLDSMIENAKENNVFDENEKATVRHKLSFEKEQTIINEDNKKQDIIRHKEEKPIQYDQNSEWKENPYIIEIDASIEKDKINALKRLLLQNQGQRKIELHLKSANGINRIKVPFGVELTEDLKLEISKLLK